MDVNMLEIKSELLAACLIVVLSLSVTWAAEEPTSTKTPDITKLVADLDADEYATRESASKKLVETGAAAVAAIEKAATSSSLEQSSRAIRVLGDMSESGKKSDKEAAVAALKRLSKSDREQVAEDASAALGSKDRRENSNARGRRGPRKKKGPLKSGKSKPLAKGTDRTGVFAVVKGGDVVKGGLTYLLKSSGEAVALLDLKKQPIRELGTFTFEFKSDVTTRTKNAMFVFGSESTNAHLVKVGAAIGTGSLNIFQGDWTGLDGGVKVNGKYKPGQKIKGVVTVDLKRRTIVARFNDQTIKADLPVDIKEIRYCGYYVKNTRSTFSALDLGASK